MKDRIGARRVRGLIIFLAGATCLVGFYLSLDRWPEEAGIGPGSGPFSFDPARVTGFSLEGPQRSLFLVLREGEWRLMRPQEAPADPEVVEGILSALAGLEPKVTVKEADEAEFGFDRPYLSLSLSLGEERKRFQVGYAADPQGGRYLRREGGGTAFLVSGEDIARLDKDLQALRDKRILALNPEGVREMEAEGPGQGWTLSRAPGRGGWRIDRIDKQGRSEAPADPLVVEELLAAVLENRIEAFVDQSPADGQALTIRLRGEEKRSWIRLWPPEKGKRTGVGRSSRHREPFLVDAGLHRAWARKAEVLGDRRLMVYDPLSAGRVEVIREEGASPLRLVVEKSPKGIWRVTRPDQSRPEAPRIDQALAVALVGSLARVRYLEEIGPEMGRVIMRLKVLGSQGRLLAGLELGRNQAGELLARRFKESRVYRLGDELRKALPGPWALDN